ncbi:hypothetical protein [Spirosoma areae]
MFISVQAPRLLNESPVAQQHILMLAHHDPGIFHVDDAECYFGIIPYTVARNSPYRPTY